MGKRKEIGGKQRNFTEMKRRGKVGGVWGEQRGRGSEIKDD